jgi:acetyl/propionyl-CoA carboxylase alpha subunit
MSDIGYITAGTMEFLYEAPTKNLYVMEVNTRIQVEHTVTEMVIGVDIIRKMIKAAAGAELGMTQEDVTIDGHAIQCRINAEDPKQGFAPSFGKITALRQAVGQFIRNDSGVYNGWEVPSHYDSLLAKICTVGRNRTLAIERMKRALDEFHIEGVNTTVPLHLAIMDHPEFVDCSFNTGFIDKHLDGLLEYEEGEGIYDVTRVAALVAEITALGHNPHCE